MGTTDLHCNINLPDFKGKRSKANMLVYAERYIKKSSWTSDKFSLSFHLSPNIKFKTLATGYQGKCLMHNIV